MIFLLIFFKLIFFFNFSLHHWLVWLLSFIVLFRFLSIGLPGMMTKLQI
jgi:hypothetical protein